MASKSVARKPRSGKAAPSVSAKPQARPIFDNSMSLDNELSNSNKLSEIALIYNEMDAIIHSIFDRLSGADTKQNRDSAYGLAMALKRGNDVLGRLTGAI